MTRLDQLGRRVTLPVAVDFFGQPAAERLKLAPGELLGQPAQFGVGLGEELGRVEVAQRVGGKIADQARAPVNVLQHALGVVGRLDAQVLADTSRSMPPGSRPRAIGRPSRACSNSKRMRMCRLYVASSASMRISDGRTSLRAK